MIAKKLVDRIASEDVKIQCAKDRRCHRKNLHDGPCKPLVRAVAENVGAEVRKLVAWAKEMAS